MIATKHTRGFTLLELMLVVAVIIILLSLLTPALSKAKAAAQKSNCMGNLRQNGLSLGMYASDYNDFYPPLGSGATWNDLWTAVMINQGYCKQSQLNCPVYKKTCNVFYTYGFIRNIVTYSVSNWASDALPIRKLCLNLRDAGFSKAQESSVAFLFDSQEWNSSGKMVYIIRPSLTAGTWPGYVWMVHNSGSNGLFLDGHVSYMKTRELADLGYPILP